jgi:hypothetical protein
VALLEVLGEQGVKQQVQHILVRQVLLVKDGMLDQT